MGNIKYINAGAGSGKTYTLTHHLADALLSTDGVSPSEVILTTFTEAAAREFREKAREVLLKEGKPELAAELNSAAIGTVHSVCQRFVQKFWYDLGLSAEMDVLSEEDKKFYINQSISDVASMDDLAFFEKFRKDFNVSKRDGVVTIPDTDFWKRYVEAIISAMSSYGVDELKDSADRSKAAAMALFNNRRTAFPDLADFLSALKSYKTGVKKWDDLRESLNMPDAYQKDLKLLNIVGDDNNKAIFNDKKIPPLDRVGTYDDVAAKLCSQSYGKEISECIDRVFRIAGVWKEQYKAYKVREHLLDFDDMEQYFLRLLTDEKYALQQKEVATYKLVMVDEFQDSNPVQVKIFNAIAKLIEPGGGRCEWVGDPKQSIYGFRGSDTDLIMKVTSGVEREVDHPLDTSYRSRPRLVKFVNDAFTIAFKGVIPDDMIRLDKQDRSAEELSKNEALIHWHCQGNKETYLKSLAKQVKKVIDSKLLVAEKKEKGEKRGKERPIRYGDIAILCRSGKEVKDTVSALRELDIPVSATTPDLLDWAEIQLVLDILRYISDPQSPELRAAIVHLMEDIPTSMILLDRLSWSEEDHAEDTWYKDKQIFKALDEIAGRVSSDNIQGMISTIILELDLHHIVGKWPGSNARIQNLSTLESLAADYESHCRRMRLSSTIAGFLSWISEQEFNQGSKDNKSDSVKVLTYHKSKGLEWKMVILESLSKDFANEDRLSCEYTSVKPLQNECGDYYIHFIPSINGTGSMPAPFVSVISALPIFKVIKDKVIAEEKRLMYVGMTRARDYLVTTSFKTERTSPPLKALEQCDLAGELEVENSIIIPEWRVESFRPLYSDITIREAPEAEDDVEETIIIEPHDWTAVKPEYEEFLPLCISPSKVSANEKLLETKAEVAISFDSLKQNIKDEAGCGTCIHNIYAAYRPGQRNWNINMAKGLINAAGLQEQITDAEGIIQAEDNLFNYLSKAFGTPNEVLRETPFTLKLNKEQATEAGLIEGQIVHGEIDMIWKLEDGSCILVDYKSYSRCDEDINAPEARKHYSGYLGQLRLYEAALKAAGFDIRKTLLYYPLQGRIVRFG